MKRIKLFMLLFATACFIGISACQSAGKKVEEAVEDAVESMEEAEETVEEVVDTTMVDTTAVAEDE